MAFDNFLQPAEAEDTQVVIIGIDENDIKAVGTTQFKPRFGKMLRILQSYKPSWSRYV